MVGSHIDEPPQQMLAVLFQTKHHAKKLLARDAVTPFQLLEGTACICNNPQLSVSLLLKHCPMGGLRCISVENIRTLIARLDPGTAAVLLLRQSISFQVESSR